MRVLVTGGAGFVGSNLAVRIAEAFAGARVVAMDNLYRRGSECTLPRLERHGVHFHEGDVREPGHFPDEGFDFLIECSAEPSVLAGLSGTPDYMVQTNLMGAYNCLERARAWKAGFLFLSSSRVYPIATLEAHPWREEASRYAWADGAGPGISPRGVSEDVPMNGARSLYGWSKLSAEQLVEEYRAAFGLAAVVNRCGMIAGPWQFGKVDQGVVSHWVQAHLFGRPLQYMGYGGKGKQVRDVLHVDDLGDLVLEQLREFARWDGWLGNVAGGQENSVSLLELTQLCEDASGRKTRVGASMEQRPADLRIFIGDCSRIFARTSWRPKRNVQATVQDLTRWVGEARSQLEAIA
ncbi:MAG TPA: NAD-dependent epimerase/dehydratase family protein [Usitatibacter sp.]|nr:NAD-dependent epimerase/dehydratase family protein [Usitatibacter sp.]